MMYTNIIIHKERKGVSSKLTRQHPNGNSLILLTIHPSIMTLIKELSTLGIANGESQFLIKIIN